MKTYRIEKKDLKDDKVLAEGYKIFGQGFKSRDYCYADENGNVEGTFHRVDGDIKECEWGLHFSKNPFDCFNFYECVQWNEFAKVRAYENIINSRDGDKTVAQVLEIVETYTFSEFIEILKKYNKDKYLSDGVNYSNGVNSSSGVNCSNGVNYSDGVNRSSGVNYSNGVNYSDGVNNSYGVIESEGISRCLFCYDFTGKLSIFNKRISEDRFNEIYNRILNFDWKPIFNNLFEMKEEKQEWYKVNIPAAFEIDNKTAWSKMPNEMKKYIQGLEEYDEEIFNKITGDLEDD